MAQLDDLTDFIRAGLAAGRSRAELSAALSAAGWSARDTAAALSGWDDAPPGLPPVPRPRAYVSAREALVYGLLFLLLGCICWHITMLGFRLVDWLLGDVRDRWLDTAALRWNMATLIPTMPLFLWLSHWVGRSTAQDPGRCRSLVRKWFASVTLLLAALALLSDAVSVIYAALNGDLTAAFTAKAVLVALLAGLVFAYYRDEFDDR